MRENNDPCVVMTGKVRLSYVYLDKPQPPMNGEGVAKYSASIIVPKSDKKTVKALNAAINAAIEKGISTKFGGKKPGNLLLPLKDGDVERSQDEAYENSYFFTAKNEKMMKLSDRNAVDCSPDEIYSGCYARVVVNFYPYNNGSRGIASTLLGIQKLEDGERLGGFNVSFDAVDDDDEDILN